MQDNLLVLDVFTDEVEVLIKEGISNLYWYKPYLRKCWLSAGVPELLVDDLFAETDVEGKPLTKRKLMNRLYDHLRKSDYNRRLEISRNFVRVLVEQKAFTKQAPEHRVEIAERAALKLKEELVSQRNQQEVRERARRRDTQAQRESYDSQRSKLNYRFVDALKLQPQKRGIELEKIFAELVRISGIPVEDAFRIEGEQIDGALKYDGRYYLVELKWCVDKSDQAQIASLYLKVEGKLDARGIFISMNGFSSEVLESLPRGKEIKVILLDGQHLTNVLCGHYTLQALLEHAISHASLRSNIYCPHEIDR
jgi:hypothetical protein